MIDVNSQRKPPIPALPYKVPEIAKSDEKWPTKSLPVPYQPFIWLTVLSIAFSVAFMAASFNIILSVSESDMQRIHQLVQRIENLQRRVDLFERISGVPTTGSESPPESSTLRILSRRKRSEDETIRRRAHRKNKFNGTIDAVAVQFTSLDPYEYSKRPMEGVLGPWIEYSDDMNVDSFGARLKDQNRMLEINRRGLYLIYAQVTYQSLNVSNSYSINVITAVDKRNAFATTCSVYTKVTDYGDATCYTSVIRRLEPGDVVYLQQGQPNREINFRKSYTYFGLVFLSG